MSLIDEARRIAPELAAAEAEASELRRLPDRVWKQLLEIGILRSLQPARFGGGGHRNAAGCTIAGPLDAVTRDVLAAVRSALDGKGEA